MKTNKEFLQQMLEYEKQGKLIFMPKTTPYEHFKIHVCKKMMTLHISIVDFAQDIQDKIKSHDFFTENSLERHLGKSVTYVNKLVDEGKYVRLTRGKGLKFYVKKDWED